MYILLNVLWLKSAKSSAYCTNLREYIDLLSTPYFKYFGVEGAEHHDVCLAMAEMLNWHRGYNEPVGGRVPLSLDCVLMMCGLRSCGAFHNSRFDVGDESTLFTGWLTAIDYVYGPRVDH